MLCSPTISSQHVPLAEMIFSFFFFKFPSTFTSHPKVSNSEQTRDCVQLLTMVSLGQNAVVLRKWQNPFGELIPRVSMLQDEGLSMGCTCYLGNAESKIEGCQEGQYVRVCVCL